MNAKKKGVALSKLSMIMIVASIIIAAMAAGLTVQQFTSGANSTSGSTSNTTPVSTSSKSSFGVQSETSSLSQAAASSTTIVSSTLSSASASYTQTSSTTASGTQTVSQSAAATSSTMTTTTSSSSSSVSTSSQSQDLKSTIPIPDSEPYDIASDPSNGYLYVSDLSSGNISIVNPATGVVDTLVLSRYNTFCGITYDSSNNLFYIAEPSSGNAQQPIRNGSVTALSPLTDKVVANVTVGVWPFGVSFVAANGEIYVTTWNTPNVRGIYGPGTISVIDGSTNTILKNITVGTQPVPLVFDNSSGNLYVGNEYSNSLSVINVALNTVVDTIAVPATPDGLAYDSSNNNIYVSGGVGSDQVSVISALTNTLIANITLPDRGLEGIAFNPSSGYVYVATGYSGFNPGAVSVIDPTTNKIVTNITVGHWPVGVTYDNSNGYVYVANYQSHSISVLS